tara:strand:- start:442 stop:699 length:258 start_codon:yes stop_codon:yes gene_type:complete
VSQDALGFFYAGDVNTTTYRLVTLDCPKVTKGQFFVLPKEPKEFLFLIKETKSSSLCFAKNQTNFFFLIKRNKNQANNVFASILA